MLLCYHHIASCNWHMWEVRDLNGYFPFNVIIGSNSDTVLIVAYDLYNIIVRTQYGVNDIRDLYD